MLLALLDIVAVEDLAGALDSGEDHEGPVSIRWLLAHPLSGPSETRIVWLANGPIVRHHLVEDGSQLFLLGRVETGLDACTFDSTRTSILLNSDVFMNLIEQIDSPTLGEM